MNTIHHHWSRRDFLKAWALGVVTWSALPAWAVSGDAEKNSGPDVWVINGENPEILMQRCLDIIQMQGGFGRHVDRLTLKVNAAWARTPEQGANTHPVLVESFLAGCRDSGMKELILPEHPCNSASSSFTRSGIQDAAKRLDAKMIDLKSNQQSFKEVGISGGRSLQEAEVAREFLETDMLVNMPVAKHHGSAVLSMAMKNWMGAVKDRGFWHRNDLHQCIADFSTFIKPQWTIIDATRTMMDRGPQGPSTRLLTPNLLIVSQDAVAADAFASTLFHDSIEAVKYLALAAEMNIGETDINRMKLHRIAA